MATTCLHEHRYVGYQLLNEEPASGMTRFMNLDYYICEPDAASAAENAQANGYWSDAVSYGIKVAKSEGGLHEEAYIADVTANFGKAGEILHLLADNQVTPCSLRDILENLFDQ